MQVNATPEFREFLQSPAYIKLTTVGAVNRVLAEGLTDFAPLEAFDKEHIKSLCKNVQTEVPKVTADVNAGIVAVPAVKGTNINMVSQIRLLTACNAVKYYRLIGRTPDLMNMRNSEVLSQFQVDWENFEKLKKQASNDVPVVKEADGVKKIINWAPYFEESMSRIFGLQGPLSYVLRKDATVPPEADDPLIGDDYYGVSGGLIQEMTSRIPLSGSLYKTDNKTVHLHLLSACKGTSCESTVKATARYDGRAAYFALLDHHAGDEKYKSISNTNLHKLQTWKWNGRSSSMERHVSTHRQCYEELLNCRRKVNVMVPGEEQRVSYLLDSIVNGDGNVTATIGLIKGDLNGMSKSFEKAAAALIDVDPFVKGKHKGGGRTATISSVDYSAGRGGTGVDLRWHTPQEYRALSKEKKDELYQWTQSDVGKEALNKSREVYLSGKKKKGKGKDDKETPKKRKKWLANYAKKPKGRAHIMSLVAKINKDDDMEVDEPTGNISSVNVWPPVPVTTNNINVPHGFYKPFELRKMKRVLRKKQKQLQTKLKYKKTELNARITNPGLTGTKTSGPILKDHKLRS
jgi:hypothetical protein